MIYGSWNIRCDRQKSLTFWAMFCPFSPLTNWKIKILTLKKTPGDIIILHICTTNDNHMMYGSWDMECDRHNFLSFWTVFCPMDPENENFLKNGKNTWYYDFTNINNNHMIYGSSDMQWNGQTFVILDHFLPFYPPLTTQKIKIWKNEKNT